MNIALGKVNFEYSLAEYPSLKNTYFITITHSTKLNGVENFCQKKIEKDRHCQTKSSDRVRAKNKTILIAATISCHQLLLQLSLTLHVHIFNMLNIYHYYFSYDLLRSALCVK